MIVGAGVAGLAALADLERAGLRVVCLEARQRIGGRVHTIRDPASPLPIELGAEFIHGRPPEIWQIIREKALAIYDVSNASVPPHNGDMGQLMGAMSNAARHADESFASFLLRSSYPAHEKEFATSYIEGFNAADSQRIGIRSLAQDEEAASKIDGDRSFRFFSGYDAIPKALAGIENVSLGEAVEAISWRKDSVEIQCIGRSLSARKVLVTVPLGVLEAIAWHPAPGDWLRAEKQLAFGQVFRVVMRFGDAFWEENADFTDAGFIFSSDQVFPTWWSALGARAPLLTGWSAGPHADALCGKSREVVIETALRSLANIMPMKTPDVQGAYFHDWSADPFSRGAYSYVPAGALDARATLAEPVADTLYLAGEATDQGGHSATVHGAIASGRRAARQIVNSER